MVCSVNRSVGLPAESTSLASSRSVVASRALRPTSYHVMAVRSSADSSAPQYVDGGSEVLGFAIMDCADEAAGLGPLVVSTSAQGRGVGRALMQRCLKEAKQKGVQSVRLINIVANVTAFSLYHSLGFRACEYCVALQGFVSRAEHQQLFDEMQADGIAVRPMARDDLAACSQLHVATTSFSRQAGIAYSFDSQPSQQCKAQHSDAQNGASAGPTVGCYVAVSASGAVLGYTTGWVKGSH